MELTGIERIEHIAERRRRLRIIMIAVPGMLAIFMILTSVLIDIDSLIWRRYFPRDIFILLALMLAAMSAFSVVMTYLQTGFKKDRSSEITNIIYQTESERFREDQSEAKEALALETDRVRSDLQLLHEELNGLKNSGLAPDEQQQAKLVESISARIKDEAATSLVKDIEKRVQTSVELSVRDRETIHQFEQSRSRLGKEIEALGIRGNLNLSLGIITTVSGLILLGVFVFSTEITSKDPVDFAIHFVPRLTLVIFIEIFAYFFLRLYKSSLSEIKYFQNEMTNIESHSIALRAATNTGDPKIVSEVISQLGKTERNHVLQKGQTTVDIERARIDKEGANDILKNLTSALQRKS